MRYSWRLLGSSHFTLYCIPCNNYIIRMANRRTINDVINPGGNPSNYQNESHQFILNEDRGANDTRTPDELRRDNDRLRQMIRQMEANKPHIEEEILSEGEMPHEYNKRIAYNDEKIRDLEEKIREQSEVMGAYQAKFEEFEENLGKLMRLDKDIHSKLVNPEHSSTLERNVKNVMVALNSGAPYDRVISMIDNIKV